MEFHGAGIQDVGGGSLLLVRVIVGVEIITAGPADSAIAAGAGKGDFLPVKLHAAHRTILRLYYEGGSGGILYRLPASRHTVNDRNALDDGGVTAGTGIRALSLCLARRAKRGVPGHGIVVMAERFPLLRAAHGASLGRFTGGLYPVMLDGVSTCFTAHGTGLGSRAGGVRPLVAERVPVGAAAHSTGFGRGAGGVLPFVVMEGAGTEQDAEQKEVWNEVETT